MNEVWVVTTHGKNSQKFLGVCAVFEHKHHADDWIENCGNLHDYYYATHRMEIQR